MPYEVLADTSVPMVVGAGRNQDTNEEFEIRESKTYAAGQVIGDDAVAPDVKEKLEDGDERVSTLLRHISHDEARKLRGAGSAGLSEVSVRDETPTDPNPHVPESAEIGQYQEPEAEAGSTAVAESPEVAETPEEAATDAGVVDESSDSSETEAEAESDDSQKENKFAASAKKKAPAKKRTAKKK